MLGSQYKRAEAKDHTQEMIEFMGFEMTKDGLKPKKDLNL